MSTWGRSLFLSLCAVATAAAAAESLVVRDAWVRATPPGARTGAAYLTIENHGGTDRLLGATSPTARTVELHGHVTEAGAQRMVRIAELALPAGATVQLTPGGLHVMLIDIVAPLTPGATVALHLTFANGEPIDVVAPVIDARTTPGPGHAAR